MQRCPLCGSELVCYDSALWHWCVSPDCGACFKDIHLDGAARRLAGLSPGEPTPAPAGGSAPRGAGEAAGRGPAPQSRP
jgi:hypothetical protein